MEPRVSVVIPSFRGAPRLGALFDRLLPALESYSWQIVLVDDGSDDSTWEVMLALAEEKKNVTCLRLRRHSGQQAATLAGCAAASGRWILTIDDDLEHDPVDIPRLLGRAEQGYDLVYAVPRSRSSGFLRSAGSLLFDLSFRLLIGKLRRIRLTSFRVLSSSLVRRMLDDRASDVYVSALALRQRPRVSSITVTPGPRAASRTSLARLVRTFTATMVAYSLLGRFTRRRPVRDLISVAEIHGSASALERRP
jgi:glycosyltransferase involved in cell wall biosynthesis